LVADALQGGTPAIHELTQLTRLGSGVGVL